MSEVVDAGGDGDFEVVSGVHLAGHEDGLVPEVVVGVDALLHLYHVDFGHPGISIDDGEEDVVGG